MGLVYNPLLNSGFDFTGTGGGGGGVTSVNGLTGAVTLAAGTNITLVPSGNTITINSTGGGSGTVTSVALSLPNIFTVSGSPVTTSGTLTGTLASQLQNLVFASPNGSSGTPTFRALVSADIPALSYANQALSNLTNPTSINQDLIPSTNATINIGSSSKVYANILSQALNISDGVTAYGTLAFGSGTPSGATANLYLSSGTALQNIGIFTQNRSTSANVNIETGNASSGNSGNVTLYTGTATGTRGSIIFRDGSQGTTGHVWTSTNTTGSGHWAVASGSVTFNKQNITLNGTDITNQYVDLAQLVTPNSLTLAVTKAYQVEGSDYTLSTVSLITRLTFAGDLATGGVSALIAGDILNIQYTF